MLNGTQIIINFDFASIYIYLIYLLADEIVINSQIIKPRPEESIESFFNDLIKNHKIVIFSKTTCPFCAKVKDLFNSLHESYASLDLDEIDRGTEIRDFLFEKTGQKTVPNVYVNGIHLGGCDNTYAAHSEGRLAKILNQSGKEQVQDTTTYDYDLVVIGGGSGGLACSKVNIF